MDETIIQKDGTQAKSCSLSPGDTLQNEKYTILKILGQGGFGITYLAKYTRLNKLVAIKEFYPKAYCNRDADTHIVTIGSTTSRALVEQLKRKFIKEAEALIAIKDDNIVTVHEMFEEFDTAYFVMDYIEGKTLATLIEERGRMSEQDTIRYTKDVCHALKTVHGLRMNHLDIKPANIMIRQFDDRAVLIDFGTAKQYDEAGDEITSMMPSFTVGYAPIEQYDPKGLALFSPQTDIYALGATMYAALTGNTPPHSAEVLKAGVPSLPSYISQKTRDAINWAMNPMRSERPADIQTFADVINPAPVIDPEPASKPSSLWMWVLALIIGAGIGYAAQFFGSEIIYDNIDIPEPFGIWFLPLLFAMPGIILLMLFLAKKSGLRQILGNAMCLLLSASAGAGVCELANPTFTFGYGEDYPMGLPGEPVISDATAELGISPESYPNEDFTVSMNEDNEFIVQNSEGYVKCRYIGDVSDGYGDISFEDIQTGSFGYEEPQWLSTAAALLTDISSWESRNDMRLGTTVSYFYNDDGDVLMKVMQ